MEKITKNNIPYNLILAMSKNKGIGKDGKLPWNLPLDMKFFKNITMKTFNENEAFNNLLSENILKSSIGNLKETLNSFTNPSDNLITKKNIVVMGRQTWESIPQKFRPLPERINIVLSRNTNFIENNPTKENLFYTKTSIEDFFDLAEKLIENKTADKIFVIGGAQIYKEFLEKFPENLNLIFQTLIQKEFESDKFFDMPTDLVPLFVSKTFIEDSEPDANFDFRIYLNPKQSQLKNSKLNLNLSNLIDPYYLNIHPQHEEMQYLNAIRDILRTGTHKSDRTGTGTISKFGLTMKFDCSKSFPLLTTKDTFWRGIVEELIWFINGDTNAKHLQEKKVRIWDGNCSREFLDKLGLTEREEGDLGPVYGFQWRHAGAEYKTMHDNYENQGVDQLINCINDIKNNPDSRRIIMSAWNPKDLNLMALPPCHVLSQFYVENGKLSLQMYQRSADMGLGVPFNIASYACLLNMVAQVTDLKVGNFIHIIGDAHVYKNHVEALEKQLQRVPRAFPILRINKDVKKIDGFKFSDFTLVNYQPYPKIQMTMAV